MNKLIQLEFYKIVKRKDSWIIYLMLFIPLLYSIGFASQAENITYNGPLNSLSALDFADDMFTFGYYIFVFLLSAGFIMVNSFRGEMDSASITLLINKICDRRKIYASKVIALGIYLLSFTCLFVLFSILCYLVFLSHTDIGNGQILGEDLWADLIRIFSIGLIYIWGVLLAGLLSSKLKVFTTMGSFTLIWAVFMYVNEFDQVRFLSPLYHLKNLIDQVTVRNFMVYVGFITISGILMAGLSIRIFERSDFS